MNQLIKIVEACKTLLLLTSTLTSAFCFLPSALYSQDTIRYMSYNLLNYGLPYNLCEESNNNITLKDQYIKTIFSYSQPDLFAVVELVQGADNADRLLDSVINIAGPRTFVRAGLTNFSNSDIVNMLYYDPLKFHLLSQDVVISGLRDINLYDFFLKTSDLSVSHDTIFLTVIVAHLKAGTGQSNELQRAEMAQSLMNYLNAHNKQGNIILSGDFNLYSSYEQAYQVLINYTNPNIRFYDPIDSPGDWNSNEVFAAVHTQSTHVSSNGCAAGGGLDDRFDFILTSNSLMVGTEGMQNIISTYHAPGQDGQHFNSSLNAQPANLSVPPDVLDALYNNSDHLPVVMDILTAKSLAIHEMGNDPFGIRVNNPVNEALTVYFGHPPVNIKIECIDFISHQAVSSLEIKRPSESITFPLTGMKTGMYLFRFTGDTGLSVVKKVMIVK
ncbi:MAG: hypothetical protein AB9842_02330 [Bacteroidales bacterium]